MIGRGAMPVVIGRVSTLLLSLMLVLSALPMFVMPASAQGTATISVSAFDADGVTPQPFARFQVASSDGDLYGPLETGLAGTVSFPVDLGAGDVTFTVELETPIACGAPQDAQVFGPLADGEAVNVSFTTPTDPNCNLGTIAVYHYACPAGFDSNAAAYEAWRDGCAEEVDGVQYEFTLLDTAQQFTPTTGSWGIPGRAPIVGLPPGDYTVEQLNAPGDEAQAFYCLTYSTPNYVTSPNPTSIDRVDAPDGIATITLDSNRVSCDVFTYPAPADLEPPTDDPLTDDPTQTPDDGDEPPVAVVGTAVTTSDLNLRAAPDGNADILVLMPAGAEVGILGEEQNGFYPVRYQDQDGWAGAQFLNLDGQQATSTTEAEPTATETAEQIVEPSDDPVGQAITNDDVNFRDGPSLDSNVLLELPANVQVDLLGDPQNGFFPVRYQDQDGWVSGEFLDIGGELATATTESTATTEATATPTATETAETIPDATNTPTVQVIIPPDQPVGFAITTSEVNLRDGASSNANILLVLPVGAELDLLGDPDNGFYPISYQGQLGWVSEAFLSLNPATETPEPEATATSTATLEPTATSTATEPAVAAAAIGTAVTTSELNMRDAPNATAPVVTVLPDNTLVEVLGEPQNGFYPIRFEGQDGWASGTFLDLGGEVEPADDPATIEIHNSVCEPGYVPGADIFDDCHEDGLDNITFLIDGPEGFSDQGVTARAGGIGPGVVIFDELAAGTYSISADVPGDVTSIFVFCSMADSDEVVAFDYTGGVQGIDIELTAGMSVICDWYIIPDVQQTNTASIELRLAACEPGYLPGNNIFDDCQGDGLADITFFIEGPDFYQNQAVTTIPNSPGPGIVTFSELAAGNYTINEDVPGDFVSIFVFCSMAGSDEVVPFEYNESLQGIVLGLTAGMAVVCDWYIIPDVQVEPAGTGYIELHKAVCEAGYEPGPDIFDDCHGQGLPNVTFFIEGPNDYDNSAVTTVPVSPGPGIVAFDDLDAGEYSINEDVPGDVTSIFVYCSLANSQQAVPFTYNDMQGIDIDITDGMAVICDWYNIPDEQETGTVIVHKRSCPVGYDDDAADFDDFFTDCITRTNDVTFTLTPDGGGSFNRDTGDDGNGRAVFTGLGQGGFTLGEDLPGEFVTRYAYCGPDDRNLSAVPVVNGNVDLELTGGAPDSVCLWFNVPEDLSGETGFISLTKYLCPDGATGNYYVNCSPYPLAGATFELDGPGANDGTLVTNTAGDARFDELPAGNYSIREIPPAGVDVAVYVVACQAGGAAYKFTYDDATGMRIKLNLPIGGEVHCNWYNIPKKQVLPPPPPSTGGQGTITVHKFLCSGKPISAYTWETDCLVQTSPEGFSLETLSGTQLATGTTNASGIIIFSGLANGAYTLDETTGEWCHAEADFVDAGGNVIVKNSGNTDVFIYNCGARQVGTLPVTGSGDTALDSGATNLMVPAAGALATMIVLFLLMPGRRRTALGLFLVR